MHASNISHNDPEQRIAMRKRLLLPAIAGCLLSCTPSISHGADSTPPPKPPILERVPTNQQWTITAYPLDAATAGAVRDDPGVPEAGTESTGRTTIIKGNRFYKVQSTAMEARETWVETDTWVAGQFSVTKKNDGRLQEEVTLLDEGSGERFGFDFSQSDFPELSWATPKHFSGVVKNGEHISLWRFENPARGSILWVDAAKRLPVAHVTQGLLHRYEFRTASPPQMPESVLDRFREWHRGRTFLNQN
jgi:hypothetical protein